MEILAVAANEIPNWFAVCMGVGTVFVGLIAIIIICSITGAICKSAAKKSEKTAKTQQTTEIQGDRQQIIAAVTAACAEEMGKDVSALRVVSFKKV